MARDQTRTLGGAESETVPARPHLVRTGTGRTPIALSTGATVIGRSKPADLVLDEEGVSRVHARILVGEGREVQLIDLGSKNGTWLNGARITAAPAHHADQITIGTVELELVFLRQVPEASGDASAVLAPLELSRREWEVAELVAQGATNAKVARALFISPSTVSTHLERIYARLEIHSRAELTALVIARRSRS